MRNIKPEIEKILRKVEKPGRYTGGEFGEVYKNLDENNIEIRFALSFPDTYEVGMSNLGIRILSGVLNNLDYVWCEKVFAPWNDMGEEMKRNNLDLYALESGDPIKEFDFLGFTLQYELCYSNILYMLELANIPFMSCERDESFPLILGGGPCAYNPEPVADIFDLIVVGEGEEVIVELTELYKKHKMADKGYVKSEYLRDVSKIEGVYVPSLYICEYDSKGQLIKFSPVYSDVNKKIKKRIIEDLDTVYFPTEPVIPFIETVHDRIMLEVFRGCIRGCRFCQAGMIYRPVREKSPDVLNKNAQELYKYTGYDEISLSSLSISDYTDLCNLVDNLTVWTDKQKINISLPSLRLDSFSKELLEKTSSVRQSTLTFAPEAGSQRMRDIINKNLSQEDILNSVRIAFEHGKTSLKLYFMIGLPFETDEDIKAIADLAQTIIGEFYKNPNRPKGKGVEISISVSTFVPKCFTPFCFEPQNTQEEIRRKQMLLRESINSKKIRYSYHESKISKLEAVFARGDRKLSRVLVEANKLGIKFDGWDEKFNFELWQEAFQNAGLDMESYSQRKYNYDDLLAWDFIDIGVNKEFLISEHKRAKNVETTSDCRTQCSFCGASDSFGGSKCCP